MNRNVFVYIIIYQTIQNNKGIIRKKIHLTHLYQSTNAQYMYME